MCYLYLILRSADIRTKKKLKCIMRTVIHPSKGNSPYSSFSKGEWAFGNFVHPLEGWFILHSPFLNPEFLAVHPWEGWFIYPFWGRSTLKVEYVHPFWRVRILHFSQTFYFYISNPLRFRLNQFYLNWKK